MPVRAEVRLLLRPGASAVTSVFVVVLRILEARSLRRMEGRVSIE